MLSSLRILQIALIITQLTSMASPTSAVNASSTVALSATSVKADQNTTVWSNSSASETAGTGMVYGGSSSIVPPINRVSSTSVKTEQSTLASPGRNVTAWSLKTSETGIVYSSSAMKTGSPMANVSVTSSTKASDVFNSSNVTTGVPCVTPSNLLTSTLLGGSGSENAAKTGSETIIVRNTTSIKLATTTNNASSVTSTRSTTLSPSGLLTGQTQSITANYSLSSASRGDSNSAEPKQTLTTSLPVSVNWTDWSVDSSDCQNYCSEKGGTVTAKRHCYSHKITLDENVCTKHDNSTKVVNCDDDQACPISGKETFGSSISTLAVSILLVMLSSTFIRD